MMKMLKCISCIVLIVTLIISVYSVNAESMEYTTNLELAKAVLGSDGLKIIEGIDENAQGVTRAKMVEIAVKSFDMYDSEVRSISYYDDVDKDYWANDFICTASETGIVHGDGDGKFRPDDFCTYAEFIKTVFRVNYWGRLYFHSPEVSPYPYNYINIAEKIGFGFKIHNHDAFVSVDDVYLLTYEMLFFNNVYMTGYGSDFIIGENILKTYYDLSYSVGMAETPDDNSVKIDGLEYHFSDGSNPNIKEGYVLYIYEEVDGNNVINIVENVSLELYEVLKEEKEKATQRVGDSNLVREVYAEMYHPQTQRDGLR